jgi:K+-transporting ATPase KdpF subunit
LSVAEVIGLVVAAALFAYLLYALFFGESL